MNALEVLVELEALGVALQVDDRRLRYRPIHAVPTDLKEAMATHKDEILDWLAWPTEAAFHAPGGPAVGNSVDTPLGDGRVVAVLPELIAVQLLDGKPKLSNFLPCEITARKQAS